MKGVTFIELLLVISLLLMLSVMTTPFVGSYLIRNNWHVASDRVLSEIWKAQAYAMDGKDIGGNQVWGVCITGNTFRLFNGSCATPNFREDYDLPAGVTVSGIGSVTFDNLNGVPSSVSTITITSNLGASTITINGAGMAEMN